MRFNQGDPVKFDAGDVKGTGTICGIALGPMPPMGRLMIVRIENCNVDTVTYPYSHIGIYENFLTVV